MILAYQLRQVNVDDKFFRSCICIRIPERNHSIRFYTTENCILLSPLRLSRTGRFRKDYETFGA